MKCRYLSMCVGYSNIKFTIHLLYDHARNITKEASNLEAEKNHLYGALQPNGYTAAFVRAASQESN